MKQVLKIDIDHRIDKWRWTRAYKKAVTNLLQGFGYKVEDIIIKPSSSGRGVHIWIKIDGKKLTEMRKVMFQFLCCDDQTRVAINRWRVKRGVKNWNKLFSKVLYKRIDTKEPCHSCRLRRIVKEMFKENNGGNSMKIKLVTKEEKGKTLYDVKAVKEKLKNKESKSDEFYRMKSLCNELGIRHIG